MGVSSLHDHLKSVGLVCGQALGTRYYWVEPEYRNTHTVAPVTIRTIALDDTNVVVSVMINHEERIHVSEKQALMLDSDDIRYLSMLGSVFFNGGTGSLTQAVHRLLDKK